ncbi:hypothetical protein IWW36_003282 [Coemansia brasiliensis]|uniref:Uncharacterized protein n=1 Tax=Coemansia brasiliensis TaxID=2650707 RepID=A0A9W8IEC1_9FUNG|nr:hypothetical protein IWW36_003282 [Coemansia brasiliensis]
MDTVSYSINPFNDSNEQMLQIAQAAVASTVDVAHEKRQEVLTRLTRYRDYYSTEIERQQERISDIEKALVSFNKQTDNDNRGCAIDRLTGLLEDAQKCLCEARLAKERQEMEIARWLLPDSPGH